MKTKKQEKRQVRSSNQLALSSAGIMCTASLSRNIESDMYNMFRVSVYQTSAKMDYALKSLSVGVNITHSPAFQSARE